MYISIILNFLGKGGVSLGGILNNEENNNSTATVSMSINPFLWRAALETIDFMPLSSADTIGGTIITDWYSTTENQKERCKLNIFISAKKLNTENLKVLLLSRVQRAVVGKQKC